MAYNKDDDAQFERTFERWGGSIGIHLVPHIAEAEFDVFLQSEELRLFVRWSGKQAGHCLSNELSTLSTRVLYLKYTLG